MVVGPGPATHDEAGELVACSGDIAAPVALVWGLVSDFGRVDRWSEGPVSCTIEGTGIGAVRTVRTPDREVRERLEGWDAIDHRISYSFVDELPLPVEHLVATIHLTGDTVTTIRWSACGTVLGAEHALVERTLRRFFDRRIDELRHIAAALARDPVENEPPTADGGPPPPRHFPR